MKVIRLKSENVMRLVAVDITPEGHLVMVGGRNGAGKSSVLNSIAVALGGLEMSPEEPIRAGESAAKIEVDLGEFRVTRRFSRDRVFDCEEQHEHDHNFCMWSWGETRSTLVVANPDGARYPSPQALLDKFLGKLTFDPLAFALEAKNDPKRAHETLRRLVGLDVAPIEDRRKLAFEERALLKKQRDVRAAQADAMKHYDDAPEAEVPVDDVAQEILRAEELKRYAGDADRHVEMVKVRMRATENEKDRRVDIVNHLKNELAKEEKLLEDTERRLTLAREELVGAEAAAREAQAAVPDVEVVREKLKAQEATNARVRANQHRAAALAEVARLAEQVEVKHQEVERAEEEKRAALAAARFPVEGLGLSDDGVTFGGLPFSQASTSEQLRVSVAIGLALNPKLKVLLIRSGNVLDEDSLAAVAKQAEEADAQLWVEWVTKDAKDVQVMIEEGRAAEAVSQ